MSKGAEELGTREAHVDASYALYWVDDLPVIMTERLMLRIALLGEEPEILDYLRRNREHLRAWEPKRDDHYFTDQAWLGAAERDQREARTKEAYRFRLLAKPLGVRDASRALDLPKVLQDEEKSATDVAHSQRYLGTVSLRNIMGFPMFNATIGYSLDHSAEGHGLMREAVAAVTRFGFEHLNLRRIEACYMPNNQRSERLLTALGFKTEGLLRSSLEVNGKWEDHNICSLINWNWRRS